MYLAPDNLPAPDLALAHITTEALVAELYLRITERDNFEADRLGLAHHYAISHLSDRGYSTADDLDLDNHPLEDFAQPILEMAYYSVGLHPVHLANPTESTTGF